MVEMLINLFVLKQFKFMAPQNWITIFNVFSFLGAFLVVISSIGACYFGNKVDDEKSRKIAELIEGKNALLNKANSTNEESIEIKRLNNLMLMAMEKAGHVKLNQDSTGKITGFIIELTGADSVQSATSTSGAISILTEDTKN